VFQQSFWMPNESRSRDWISSQRDGRLVQPDEDAGANRSVVERHQRLTSNWLDFETGGPTKWSARDLMGLARPWFAPGSSLLGSKDLQVEECDLRSLRVLNIPFDRCFGLSSRTNHGSTFWLFISCTDSIGHILVPRFSHRQNIHCLRGITAGRRCSEKSVELRHCGYW
jgi:hypothetical protein